MQPKTLFSVVVVVILAASIAAASSTTTLRTKNRRGEQECPSGCRSRKSMKKRCRMFSSCMLERCPQEKLTGKPDTKRRRRLFRCVPKSSLIPSAIPSQSPTPSVSTTPSTTPTMSPSATPSRTPTPSVTPSTTPSPTPSSSPVPTPNGVVYFQGRPSCPTGTTFVTTGFGSGCDPSEILFIYRVELTAAINPRAVCSTGLVSFGSAPSTKQSGCIMCGDGATVIRTVTVRTDGPGAAANSCEHVAMTRAVTARMYQVAEADGVTLCDIDYTIANGGTYSTQTLPDKMPSILTDIFCE